MVKIAILFYFILFVWASYTRNEKFELFFEKNDLCPSRIKIQGQFEIFREKPPLLFTHNSILYE
jgi:hypothetical protein